MKKDIKDKVVKIKCKGHYENNTKKIGIVGELAAKKYFINKGYAVLEMNFRRRVGEIDLICTKDSILHIIEVKTVILRQAAVDLNNIYIRPEEKLTSTKIKKLIKMAEIYKMSKNLTLIYQIDALCVYLSYVDKSLEKVQVRYIPNIHI